MTAPREEPSRAGRARRFELPFERVMHGKWRARPTLLNLINDGNAPNRKPKNDDEFDAYVAYLLGAKWLSGDGVVLLGDDATGSFLVPAEDKLQNEFESLAKT